MVHSRYQGPCDMDQMCCKGLRFSTAMHMSVNGNKTTVHTDFWITNTLLQMGKFTSTESLNNEVDECQMALNAMEKNG